MQRFSYLLLFLVMLPLQMVCGQVMLQMERYGTPQTRKFQVGERLSYRTVNNSEWTTEEIIRLIPEDSIIVTENRYLRLSEVTSIRIRRDWNTALGYTFLSFGGGWWLFSAGAALVDPDDPFQFGDLLVGGISLVLSALLIFGLRWRRFRLGKKRWLRIVDLTVFGGKP
jgi:hypothetical protein